MKSEKVWTSLLLTSSLLLFTSAANADARVKFLDYDATAGTFTNAEQSCTFVTRDTRTLTTGWWAVDDSVTIPEGNRLVVQGDVHLVLCDGATLKIENPGAAQAAIRTTGASLTIYGPTSGSGALVAVGGPVDNHSQGGTGIGGDATEAGGTVTINGGSVTATSGGYSAAGIGGGCSGSGGTVTINGGSVTATGRVYGAGIGGGYNGGGTVTINGGTVTAQGGQQAAAIGGGRNGGGTVTINGGIVTATGGLEGVDIGIGAGYHEETGSVTISGGAIHASSLEGVIQISGGIFTNEPQAGWLIAEYGVFENPDETTKAAYPYAVMRLDIPYLDWDANRRKMTNAVVQVGHWTEVTADTRTLEDGAWYVVRGNVVFPDGNLTVRGSAHLILCDGSALTIENPGEEKAAVSLPEGTHLAIYGQTKGSGCLTAHGGEMGAGIGGGRNESGGTLTINGGTVKATGGGGAAGIGGGKQGSGGTLTITGGAIHTSGIEGSVQISGGIFNVPIPASWCASHFAPSNNSDPTTREDYPYAVVPAWEVTIGPLLKTTAVWTSGDGSVTNAIDGISFCVPVETENVSVIFTAKPDYVLEGQATVELGTVTEDITFGIGNEYAEPRAYCKYGDIPYLDWNGSQMTNAVLSKYDYALVTSEMEEMADGWYVVARNVERGCIKVKGEVNLVLVDGCELKVRADNSDEPGIEVKSGDRLAIYGQVNGSGKLTATGNDYGAGIGGGHYVSGGAVTINGGTVTATGGLWGAGIGGGSYAGGGIVTICGGAVTARGNGGGEDIGHGKGDSFESGTISVSGGIFWTEPGDAWLAPECAKVENADETTKSEYPWRVIPPCVVTIGNFPRGTIAWTSDDGSVTNMVDGGAFNVKYGSENVKVIFTAKSGYELVGETVVDLGTVTADIAFGSGSDYKVPNVRTLPVQYVDADGTVRTKAFTEFIKVKADTKKLEDGKWYAVIDDVALTASLPVEGAAHLILCDWATLAITNKTADAAISVGGGASLTIYGQTENTGRLAVSGGDAGIGGKANAVCGAVTIHGGTVSASAMANKHSAGIGSGGLGSGGSVTITGGRITAQGGEGAEDIGSGWNASSPCAVAISGGIFTREPQTAWLAAGYTVIPNPDAATVAAYPWAVVPYPATWPEADDAVKAKFGAWRKGVGVDADLTTDDAQKAFLLNVAVENIKELKIESLTVDDEGYATIVVSAPGAFFFDRIDFGNINGILYIEAGKTLKDMEPKAVTYWTSTAGKATIKVKENFIRAVIGFKRPDVSADTLLPPEQE